VRAHRGGVNGKQWRCERAGGETGRCLNRRASAWVGTRASPRSKGRVKGRRVVCEAHNASPAGGMAGGSDHVRTCTGAWRNTSPSCSGCERVMMIPTSGAHPTSEVRGPGHRCAAWRRGRDALARARARAWHGRLHFKLPVFECFKFKIYKKNFITATKICRGDIHLHFL
jgi:hypothetical protein